jgi:hypothetical protein
MEGRILKLVAVIPHFYQERLKNISEIVTDLGAGTKKPDEIIVFNNNRDFHFYGGKVTLVNSTRNFDSLVRYAISLASDGDVIFTIDDDLTVGKETIALMLEHLATYPDCVLGMFGRNLNRDSDKPYSGGEVIELPSKLTEVDICLGRIMMFRREKITSIFDLINKCQGLPDEKGRYEDDIIMSFANKCLLVPADDKSKCWEMDDGNVGYVLTRKDHWQKRDRTAKILLHHERISDSRGS